MAQRNAAYTGHAIEMNLRNMDAEEPNKSRSCREHCRNFGTCIRVSPWVPLIGAVMITTALPVWAIFTRRALESTKAFSDLLLGVRTFAVEQMSSDVSWVTGLGVIVISAVVGLCVVLSLLRSYQETARLPTTKCGPPGRISYASYVTLISAITFGLWLVTVVVALLIAAQLCWLLLAFMFEAALVRGVQPATAAAAPVARGDLCPASCMNLGSFHVVFEAAASCICRDAAQYPVLRGLATDTWKYLVHALAALALMGLAGLWLIMNLSAQFAHARRDLQELRRRYAPEPQQRDPRGFSDDEAAGAVYITAKAPYTRVFEKRSGGGHKAQTQDALTADLDTAKPSKPSSAAAPRRAAPDALPDSVLSPAPAASAAPPRPPSSTDEQLAQLEASLEVPAASAGGGAAAPATGVAGQGEMGAPLLAGQEGSEGEAGPARREGFGGGSTAQRYAAYRLRAAQAQANKAQAERKWSR